MSIKSIKEVTFLKIDVLIFNKLKLKRYSWLYDNSSTHLSRLLKDKVHASFKLKTQTHSNLNTLVLYCNNTQRQ